MLWLGVVSQASVTDPLQVADRLVHVTPLKCRCWKHAGISGMSRSFSGFCVWAQEYFCLEIILLSIRSRKKDYIKDEVWSESEELYSALLHECFEPNLHPSFSAWIQECLAGKKEEYIFSTNPSPPNVPCRAFHWFPHGFVTKRHCQFPRHVRVLNIL